MDCALPRRGWDSEWAWTQADYHFQALGGESLPDNFTVWDIWSPASSGEQSNVSQRLDLSGFGWEMLKLCKKALWSHSKEKTGKSWPYSCLKRLFPFFLFFIFFIFYFFAATDHFKVSASSLSFWWLSLVTSGVVSVTNFDIFLLNIISSWSYGSEF